MADAYDRYLKTPIDFKGDLLPDAFGTYDDSFPVLRPKGQITIDKSLKDKNNPYGVDPSDILRHEIIHSALDKFKVNNNQINYPQDGSRGADLKNSLQKRLPSDEWVTTALTSKNGKYTPQVGFGPQTTKDYQKYLLQSIMDSPSVHPKFKELLKRMGYGS